MLCVLSAFVASKFKHQPYNINIMDKLIQKQGFYYKSFELKEEEVQVTSHDFENESAYSVDYLSLGVRTYRHEAKKSRAWQWILWLAISLSVLALIIEGAWEYEIIARGWIGTLLLLASLVILWFKLKEEPAMVHLIGGQEKLELLAIEPNEKEVKSFLKSINKRIRKAYRDQYLDNEEDVLPEEKKTRIEWLHELKMISRTEKDQLLDEVKEERANGIGFRLR